MLCCRYNSTVLYRLDTNTPLLCQTQRTSFSLVLLLILDGRLASSPVAALPQQNVDRKRRCRSTQPLVPGSNDAIQSLGPPCIPVSRRYVWRRLGDQRYWGSGRQEEQTRRVERGNDTATATVLLTGDWDCNHDRYHNREYSRPSLMLCRPSSSLNQHNSCSQSLGP
jgi:hypothetical protein